MGRSFHYKALAGSTYTKDINVTIWLKTWSQLIQENKHRLQFLREKLDLNIAGEDAFTYLKKTYAEYTRGL